MRALLPVLVCFLAAQDERKPVPDEKTRREFDALVRDVFKADFARTAAKDRKALVAKLLQQAAETPDDPNAVYALLVHAATLAGQVADVKAGMHAVDELVKRFVVDPVAVRKSFLGEASKYARTPDELGALAEAYLILATQAVAAESYEEAQSAAAAASSLAKRARNIPQVNRAEARLREIDEQKAMGEMIRKAREALAQNPDDALANFLVGRHECVAGNWPKGLGLLAKGSDAAWKEAAARDARDPALPAEQVAAGDGWWDLADKEKAAARRELLRRAAHWYGRAQDKVIGLTLVRIQRRLADISATTPGVSPGSLVAHWTFDEGAGTSATDVVGGARADAAGALAWAPGRSGGAVKLDGSAFLSVAEAGAFNFGAGSFTLSCWINLSGTTHFRLANKWDHPKLRGWLLDVNAGPTLPGGALQRIPGHVRVRLSDGTHHVIYGVDGGLAPGAWRHVAMAVDRSAKEMRLYVDGAPIGEPQSMANFTESLDTPAPLAFGAIPGAPDFHINGAIDEVKIFREALSGAAIKGLAEKQ